MLIIIDLFDVKDYDDVVYVELDEDFENDGGFVVYVVIVDVVYYVMFGLFMDWEVNLCGNLVYFLDWVILMLLECIFN